MPIDYSKYPPNWLTEIRPRILERASNRCEVCGIENGMEATSLAIWVKTIVDDKSKYQIRRFWLCDPSDIARMELYAIPNETKRVKVVLTIAHLDHDEDNHEVDDDRLAAMCQWCHLNYDASEKMRRIMAKADSAQLPLIPVTDRQESK